MKLLMFLLVACLTPILDIVGQGLVLKNGELVAGDVKIKYNETGSAAVSVADKLFSSSEVRGYMKSATEPMKYLAPITNPDSRRVEWDFLERLLDGEILLYTWVEKDKIAERKFLMAHHGDQFGFVFGSFADPGSEAEMNARLKSLAGDEPSLSGALDSIANNKTFEGIINIVQRYNDLKYKPGSNESPLASVIFYVKPTNKLYPFTVVVDENKQYGLTLKAPLTIPLHDNQSTRICVSSGNLKSCILVRSTSCCRQYIEVFPEIKKGKIVLSRATESEANYNIGRGMTR